MACNRMHMGDKSPKNKVKKQVQRDAATAQTKSDVKKRQNDFDRSAKKPS